MISCNPCYNGNDIQCEIVKFVCSPVVILVIMEMIYNFPRTQRERGWVVILVIMEMRYNFTWT